MSERVALKTRDLKYVLFGIGLAVLVAIAVVILMDQFEGSGLVLILALVSLIISLVLLKVSQQWWAKDHTLSLIVPVMLIGVWLATQVWYNGLPLTWPYLKLAVRWKNYIGVLAVVVGILFLLHKRLISHTAFFLYLMSLPFLFVATLSVQSRPDPNWPLIFMYAGWGVYVFLVIPTLLRTRRSWLFAIKALVIMPLLPMAWYIWSGISSGRYYSANPNYPRIIFTFNAPHAYGSALMVGLIGIIVIILNSSSRKAQRLWVALALVLGVLLVLSYSRANLAFVGFFLLSIGIYTRRRFRALVLPTLYIVVILTIATVWLLLDYQQIESFSSGRLSKFSEAVQASLENAPLDGWLLGTSFQEIYETNPRFVYEYHEVVASDRYQRAHIENNYLQIVLSHGLLGFLTFVLPFTILYVWLHQVLTTCRAPYRINIIVAIASINALAVHSLVQSSIPSFGNSLAIFVPILWLPPLLHHLASRKIDRRSADKTMHAQRLTSMQDTLSHQQKVANV